MLVLAFPIPLLLVEPALGVEVAPRALAEEEVGAEFKCCVLSIACVVAVWLVVAMLFGVQGDNRPKLPKLDGVWGEKGYFTKEG